MARPPFTTILVECYSTVGRWLERFIGKSESTANPSLWEAMFIGQILLLAVFVLATPLMFGWAFVRWVKG